MRKVLFILAELSDEDVDWLAKTGSRINVPPSTPLITEGKPVNDLFIVLSGKLSVSMHGVGEIAEIGAGEVIGEMSFIDKRPPSASVTATTECRMLYISRDAIDLHISQSPMFAAHFYKAIAAFLSDRLRGTVSRLGFGKIQKLSDEEMDGELDMELLEKLHLAGARFDRILQRLGG